MPSASAAQRPVTSTYRLQLHAEFTFADAAEVVPYLADLGVSHVYLSPVLTSMPGSLHGYDVLDHGQIDPELGGEEGLRALARTAHESGLGLVVDIVPNHMAFAPPQWRNAQAWQVLAQGRNGPTSHWFDIDWDALDGRIGVPVLGNTLNLTLAADELVLDVGRTDEGPAAGQPVIRYYDHVFPVAPGTLREDGETGQHHAEHDDERQAHEQHGAAGEQPALVGADDVAQVVQRQHYLLSSWREADAFLNYRRFFEVDTLIGVRVEEPDVFEATHALLLALNHEGVIDGFRVDHPDGLADPSGYLQALHDASTQGTAIWVEKILEDAEQLPEDWACSGTTGYDALAAISLALVDPDSSAEITRAWARVGGTSDLADVIDACKNDSVEDLLGPEVARLVRRASQVFPERSADELQAAIRELLVAVTVYRAYVRPGTKPTETALDHLDAAVDKARQAAPEHREVIEAVGAVLIDPDAGAGDPEAARDLCVRFQQTTGPVMAKSVEDTAFYRWHRLTALNEVGVNPSRGANPDLRNLQDWAAHQQSRWPEGMTTLSTHDTKRSEDVRARLIAIAGDEQAWQECRKAAYEEAVEHALNGSVMHLIWQTLAGVGPISAARLREYLTKAVREAKVHTSWVEPQEEYETRVLECAERARTGGDLHDAIERAVERSRHQIEATILGQKLLQLTLPGVPDTYQGSEVVDLSLVDPDNRRPVNYDRRQQALARIDAGEDPTDLESMKLLVTARTLRLRRDRPEIFGASGSYRPLHAGPHLVGHVRAERVAALALWAPHRVDGPALASQRVELVPGAWRDELTGRRFDVAGGGLVLSEAFMDAPVALLVREGSE
ncbi:MAG: malto-oligosyltrehalose synthase [Ornithinimicrobium sp.]